MKARDEVMLVKFTTCVSYPLLAAGKCRSTKHPPSAWAGGHWLSGVYTFAQSKQEMFDPPDIATEVGMHHEWFTTARKENLSEKFIEKQADGNKVQGNK